MLVAAASNRAGEAMTPPGVTIRSVTGRRDLEHVAAMETDVWGEDWSWLADDLTDRIDSAPNGVLVGCLWVAGHSSGWINEVDHRGWASGMICRARRRKSIWSSNRFSATISSLAM